MKCIWRDKSWLKTLKQLISQSEGKSLEFKCALSSPRHLRISLGNDGQWSGDLRAKVKAVTGGAEDD